MKEQGFIHDAALKSEKAGYVLGTATLTTIILLGSVVSPAVAVNLLASSAVLVFGGKLAQKKA